MAESRLRNIQRFRRLPIVLRFCQLSEVFLIFDIHFSLLMSAYFRKKRLHLCLLLRNHCQICRPILNYQPVAGASLFTITPRNESKGLA